jgi:hypothetical protein
METPTKLLAVGDHLDLSFSDGSYLSGTIYKVDLPFLLYHLNVDGGGKASVTMEFVDAYMDAKLDLNL